jgi:hypothetical protein
MNRVRSGVRRLLRLIRLAAQLVDDADVAKNIVQHDAEAVWWLEPTSHPDATLTQPGDPPHGSTRRRVGHTPRKDTLTGEATSSCPDGISLTRVVGVSGNRKTVTSEEPVEPIAHRKKVSRCPGFACGTRETGGSSVPFASSRV